MAAIFSLYALSYLLSTYLLARRRRSVIALLAATFAVQLAGFFVFHSTIPELMGVLAVSFGFLLVGAAVLAGVGPARTGAAAGAATIPADPPAGAGRGLAAGWRERVVAEVTRAVGPAPVLSPGAARWARRRSERLDLSVVVALWRIPGALARTGAGRAEAARRARRRGQRQPRPALPPRAPGGEPLRRQAARRGGRPPRPRRVGPGSPRAARVRAFAASSALLSATGELLRGFDPRAMREGAAPGPSARWPRPRCWWPR